MDNSLKDNETVVITYKEIRKRQSLLWEYSSFSNKSSLWKATTYCQLKQYLKISDLGEACVIQYIQT